MSLDAIQVSDSIEGSGYPLAFKFRQGPARSGLITGQAAHDVFKVEARAMGGHQKEAVVTEGDTGSAWRLASDEGAGLNGTDLAPFPLGFFNAGVQADLLGRIRMLADAQGVPLDGLSSKLLNRYAFRGSFFKGTGLGSAEPGKLTVRVHSSADAATVTKLVQAALRASPAIAACATALRSTFALYVNGRRRPLLNAPASSAPDAGDPLKIYQGLPRPLEASGDLPDLITKLSAPPAEASDTAGTPIPGESAKLDIHIGGRTRLVDRAGITETETSILRPTHGSHFALKTDERDAPIDQGPSGLALQAAGVAFCLLTQLLRYTEYHEFKLRAIRLVQYSPYRLIGTAADGTLTGRAEPYDTHLMVHGDESDETMEQLLVMAATTCYLHATLLGALTPVVRLELNGAPVG